MQKDANLVELEKCCQTHIFLQNFVLIQPRTSPPKFYKISLFFPILLHPNPGDVRARVRGPAQDELAGALREGWRPEGAERRDPAGHPAASRPQAMFFLTPS